MHYVQPTLIYSKLHILYSSEYNLTLSNKEHDLLQATEYKKMD